MKFTSYQQLKIIDTHCHLWNLSRGYYPWLEQKATMLLGGLSKIQRDYLPDDYLSDSHAYFVEKFIHIEAAASRYSKQEVEWVLEQSNSCPQLAGIIAGIDLLQENDELLRFYQQTQLVKGVRQILSWHEDARYRVVDENLLVNANWLLQFQKLASYQLLFDMQVCPSQLLDVARLAKKNPDIMVVLEHAGSPLKREEREWRQGMRVLSQCDNLSVKLSGFGMFDHHWSADSIRDKVLFAIECFGIDRCMFASNFPVDSLYTNYSKLMRCYLDVVSDFSFEEKQKLFSDNAKRVYQL